MKRFICIACLVLLFLTMSACDPGTYQFREDLNAGDVVSVELIRYENPKQKMFRSWVPDHFKRLGDLDLSSVTVLETLEEDKKAEFLNQLSRENILLHYYVFNSPKGICLRINYSNGDFLIVNNDCESKTYRGYIGMYNAEGEVTEFYGTFVRYDSFESLVNDYFETKV